jgi:hypothetical protein
VRVVRKYAQLYWFGTNTDFVSMNKHRLSSYVSSEAVRMSQSHIFIHWSIVTATQQGAGRDAPRARQFSAETCLTTPQRFSALDDATNAQKVAGVRMSIKADHHSSFSLSAPSSSTYTPYLHDEARHCNLPAARYHWHQQPDRHRGISLLLLWCSARPLRRGRVPRAPRSRSSGRQ